MASRVKKSMEARSCKFRTYSYKFRKRKDYGCSEVQFAPKFPQNGRLLVQNSRNLPKLRESCAPWQKLRGCAKTQKLRKSCAPQHCNFLVGLVKWVMSSSWETDLWTTCHMGSNSVTCHPTQVAYTRPALTPIGKLVLNLPTHEGCKAELT